MELKLVLFFIFKFIEVFCESIDPIDTEFYQGVVLNRTVQQEIAKAKNSKIVNGSPAVLGQFDYFVIVYGENRRYLCGGTLIKVNWVMTAGHCLHEISNVEVHFGTVNRRTSPERMLKIEDDNHLIVHEHFDSRELFNDIGLIYLEKMSIAWLESSSIGFIEPKLYNEDITNLTATICGFGKTSDNSGASYILNYINIPIMDYKQCEVYYYLDENNICVSTKSGKSPCNGDSGGGVVVTNENNEQILVGIVSFGTSLCEIKYPVVLTKVSNYINWMQDKFNYFKNPTTSESAPTTTTTSETASTTTSVTAQKSTTTSASFEDGTTTISTKSITTPNSVAAVYVDKWMIFVIMAVMILVNLNLRT